MHTPIVFHLASYETINNAAEKSAPLKCFLEMLGQQRIRCIYADIISLLFYDHAQKAAIIVFVFPHILYVFRFGDPAAINQAAKIK